MEQKMLTKTPPIAAPKFAFLIELGDISDAIAVRIDRRQEVEKPDTPPKKSKI